MNTCLAPYVDATHTSEELAGLSVKALRAIRAAASRVERVAWTEELKRVARGQDHEVRLTREREMLPNALRQRVLSGDINFRGVSTRGVMQCRDWALQIHEAADAAMTAKRNG